jgi:hypothetical protein
VLREVRRLWRASAARQAPIHPPKPSGKQARPLPAASAWARSRACGHCEAPGLAPRPPQVRLCLDKAATKLVDCSNILRLPPLASFEPTAAADGNASSLWVADGRSTGRAESSGPGGAGAGGVEGAAPPLRYGTCGTAGTDPIAFPAYLESGAGASVPWGVLLQTLVASLLLAAALVGGYTLLQVGREGEEGLGDWAHRTRYPPRAWRRMAGEEKPHAAAHAPPRPPGGSPRSAGASSPRSSRPRPLWR